MKNITPQIVKDYHAYMAKKFNAVIIQKKDAAGMLFIDHALSLMGVKKKGYFLDHFALTLGNRIYIHWEPGVGTPQQLAYQIRVLAHECQHVLQYRDDPRFALRYLLSKSRRAHFEAQAMHCDLELYHWLYGAAMSVALLTGTLKYYRVRSADRAVARQDLNIYNQAVSRGQISTKPGKVAIRWLQARVK